MDDLVHKIRPMVEALVFKSVGVDDQLYSSHLIDSMGTVELALLLEEEFDIKIDTRDITEVNFDSVAKLASYIRKRLNE